VVADSANPDVPGCGFGYSLNPACSGFYSREARYEDKQQVKAKDILKLMWHNMFPDEIKLNYHRGDAPLRFAHLADYKPRIEYRISIAYRDARVRVRQLDDSLRLAVRGNRDYQDDNKLTTYIGVRFNW
jgi:hypothetical protein